MDTTLYLTLSHQSAAEKKLDVLANNIANSNTTGFRRETVAFDEWVTVIAGGSAPASVRSLSYSRLVGVTMDFSDGALRPTHNPLDVAVQGPGFLTVQNAAGDTLYTRNGHLTLNDSGQLSTTDGYLVLDDGGVTILIDPQAKQITIAKDGTISTDLGPVTKMGLVEFPNPAVLERRGASLFSASERPVPAESSVILQGMIENSNVNPVLEMTQLISVSRGYQAVANIMKNYQDLRDQAIRELGRIQ